MDKVCEIRKLRKSIAAARSAGKSIGFVPTMGALHEGHLSLVRGAKAENDYVVVSIFVNPAQFGQGEDLEKYPRDPDGDCAKLESLGADLVFMPEAKAMYGENAMTRIVPDTKLVNRLCGLSRPGHFEGVATAVVKLFNIVQPNVAYFGQKDYQQSVIIRRITRDLDFDIRIRVLPTVREPDGLAMSSRNAYLSEAGCTRACAMYRALNAAKENILDGERSSEKVRNLMISVIEAADGVRIDYIEIVNAETLKTMEKLSGRIVLIGAVYIGKTRLIDNILLDVPE
ncbi:MAG: pantoate--beta-alanine ligase [Planctomycetota bacterium]|jgi:pantoate--beta-alanine ligase